MNIKKSQPGKQQETKNNNKKDGSSQRRDKGSDQVGGERPRKVPLKLLKYVFIL